MKQAMNIEEPVTPIEFPQKRGGLLETEDERITIGEFYARLDALLSELPESAWHKNRRQIDDKQFFQGQIFNVNNYADANRAINDIVSEGEGAADTPLDFENELAHFYRFEEIFKNQVLTKANNPKGYEWGAPLGVDWSAVYPAISDPESFDFSGESDEVKASQLACNIAFSQMVDDLTDAFNTNTGKLGNGVRAMFDIRMAALKAFNTPLSNGKVAGPAFKYIAAIERTSNVEGALL
jgi:hypothetical protein